MLPHRAVSTLLAGALPAVSSVPFAYSVWNPSACLYENDHANPKKTRNCNPMMGLIQPSCPLQWHHVAMAFGCAKRDVSWRHFPLSHLPRVCRIPLRSCSRQCLADSCVTLPFSNAKALIGSQVLSLTLYSAQCVTNRHLCLYLCCKIDSTPPPLSFLLPVEDPGLH